MKYPAISYATAHKWERLAAQRGVSAVARSSRGFMRAYQKAGTFARLPDAWKRKRAAFIARHMAQGKSERLWKDGKPSRRALALIMWAYMPARRNPETLNTRKLKRPEWLKYSRVKHVVYHGTTSPTPFGGFDIAKSDLGIHVGSLEQAEYRLRYGPAQSIMPLWFNVTNLLRLKDVGSFHCDAIAGQLVKKKIISKSLATEIKIEVEKSWRNRLIYDEVLRKAIQEAGYDGVVYRNETEGSGDSWIALDPRQLKSALANKGSFDPKDPVMTNPATHTMKTIKTGAPSRSEYLKLFDGPLSKRFGSPEHARKMDDYYDRVNAARRLVERKAKGYDIVRVTLQGDKFAVIHDSPNATGLQVSLMDRKGPYGHFNAPSIGPALSRLQDDYDATFSEVTLLGNRSGTLRQRTRKNPASSAPAIHKTNKKDVFVYKNMVAGMGKRVVKVKNGKPTPISPYFWGDAPPQVFDNWLKKNGLRLVGSWLI